MPIKLPPGMTPAVFRRAVAEFKAVVGARWVFTSEEDLDTYRDAYSDRWGDPDEYLASAAVAPNSVEEVQAIVRIANKYKIPLYPISTGKNLTYGGSAPTYSGSVVLDLKRMNRVIRVDDKRNFALVEPGCSYFDLYNYIKERGLKVWIDCPDPGWGSPIGNALDHGVGYTGTPFHDHFGSHCGMEVVTPTGELIRTGMGALPNADSWQDYRYGVGPHVDGLFGQSNFGIVTKMGFWLMPQPDYWMTGSVSVPLYSDLGPLIDNLNYLEDMGIANGQHLYGSPLGQAPSKQAEIQALMASGWPTNEQLDAFCKQSGLPAYRVKLNFYGPEKTVRANWEYTQERLGKAIPGATFGDVEILPMPLTAEQEKTHHLVHFGIPNMAVFAMMARQPGDPDPKQGHVDFFAVCPRSADWIVRSRKVIYETQRALGVTPLNASPFALLVNWHHRAFFVGAPGISSYRDNRDKNKRARELYEAYLTNLAKIGVAPYRTHPGAQDLLVSKYSFNNGALLKFQEAMKDAIDPNGIVSPGRYGIWPKRLRAANKKGARA